MRKKFAPKKRRTRFLIALLAVCCIGGTELAASYFYAPEVFEAITAPVIHGFVSARSFAGRLVSDISCYLSEHSGPRLSPETSNETSQAVTPITPPPITQLKLQDGHSILTGGIMDVEYFQQSAPPWDALPYGTDDLGRYGCGPTAMAMVVNSMTAYETDPMQMAQWSVEHHHWAKRSGSYHSLVPDVCKAFGLRVYSISGKTPEAIEDALLSGHLVVALTGPGHFTDGGHFIIIRGTTPDGSLLIADSNSLERSLMAWDPQIILEELSPSTNNGAPLWAIAPGSS